MECLCSPGHSGQGWEQTDRFITVTCSIKLLPELLPSILPLILVNDPHYDGVWKGKCWEVIRSRGWNSHKWD